MLLVLPGQAHRPSVTGSDVLHRYTLPTATHTPIFTAQRLEPDLPCHRILLPQVPHPSPEGPQFWSIVRKSSHRLPPQIPGFCVATNESVLTVTVLAFSTMALLAARLLFCVRELIIEQGTWHGRPPQTSAAQIGGQRKRERMTLFRVIYPQKPYTHWQMSFQKLRMVPPTN